MSGDSPLAIGRTRFQLRQSARARRQGPGTAWTLLSTSVLRRGLLSFPGAQGALLLPARRVGRGGSNRCIRCVGIRNSFGWTVLSAVSSDTIAHLGCDFSTGAQKAIVFAIFNRCSKVCPSRSHASLETMSWTRITCCLQALPAQAASPTSRE